MRRDEVNPQHLQARAPALVGILALMMLVGSVGWWSVQASISGAIIAQGHITVENNRQVIQHGEGGIVKLILARNGDRVTAGQVVVQLDETLLRAELKTIQTQMVELAAREARFAAERDGAAELALDPALLEIALKNTDVRDQIDGQTQLFLKRLKSLEETEHTLFERLEYLSNQIAGIQMQKEAVALQSEVVLSELTAQASLLQKGLTQSLRVTELKREHARLSGELGRLTASIAHLRGERSTLTLEHAQLRANFHQEAIGSLQDIRFRRLELVQKEISLSSRLARSKIRAPVDGIIYESTIFAPDAVVRPAEDLMFVIPQDRKLLVSARVRAADADQIFIGQKANLRFTAFNQRETPEIAGIVTLISADASVDDRTGAAFFEVEVTPDPDSFGNLPTGQLLPGMPVEAFVRTDERSPFSYIAKPVTDYFAHAMRDG